MKMFLGMEIEPFKQGNMSIQLHLDHYVCNIFDEYKGYIQKLLRPTRVPISPGIIELSFLEQRIAPLSLIQPNRSFTGHSLPSFSLLLHRFVFDLDHALV